MIGTSLKVGGSVVEFIKQLDDSVPLVLINKETIEIPKGLPIEGFDLEIIGDCDDIILSICQAINYTFVGDEKTRDREEVARTFYKIDDRKYSVKIENNLQTKDNLYFNLPESNSTNTNNNNKRKRK